MDSWGFYLHWHRHQLEVLHRAWRAVQRHHPSAGNSHTDQSVYVAHSNHVSGNRRCGWVHCQRLCDFQRGHCHGRNYPERRVPDCHRWDHNLCRVHHPRCDAGHGLPDVHRGVCAGKWGGGNAGYVKRREHLARWLHGGHDLLRCEHIQQHVQTCSSSRRHGHNGKYVSGRGHHRYAAVHRQLHKRRGHSHRCLPNQYWL